MPDNNLLQMGDEKEDLMKAIEKVASVGGENPLRNKAYLLALASANVRRSARVLVSPWQD